MTPYKPEQKKKQLELLHPPLIDVINNDHPMVKLSQVVNWDRLDELFGKTFNENNGRPGISTRLMVALHYLKYTYNLSDQEVVKQWVENPYWQYFSGMRYFQYNLPIDPSSMTRWRKRIGESGAEDLLNETIQSGLKINAIKKYEIKNINVDTTVQEKAIRFPTDARLYDRARENLVKEAKKHNINLRQTYTHKSKEMLLKQSRYSHAKQYKRSVKCIKSLKNYLGRVIRDIERKCNKLNPELSSLLEISRKIYNQKPKDKNKIYSVHEPKVECISKGKAHKRYEFGCKVSVAVTSKGGWFVGAKAIHGNPYDGHTLKEALEQVESMGIHAENVFVDMGYRGHNYTGESTVHVDKKRRGKISKSLWKWMKRRSAVEPSIGHLKNEHKMDKNRLKGEIGDKINAILSAAGMNFWKLLGRAEDFWIIFWRYFLQSQQNHYMLMAK